MSDLAARSQALSPAPSPDAAAVPVAASSATPATPPEPPNNVSSPGAAKVDAAPAAGDDKIETPPANLSDLAARPQALPTAPTRDASALPVAASSATPATSPEPPDNVSSAGAANVDAAPATPEKAERGVSEKEIESEKKTHVAVEQPPAAAAAAQVLAPKDRQASPPAARVDTVRRQPPVHFNPIVGYDGMTPPAPWRHRQPRPQQALGRAAEEALASARRAAREEASAKAEEASAKAEEASAFGPAGGASRRSLGFGSAPIPAGGSSASLDLDGAKVRLAMKRLCPT
ncbi:MAG: hypothetical protein JO288_18910, partial [Hyphomicrobiales bacterium]|nr:hypothetical protein [Hyphomicrobiales bacterium]